MMCEYSTPLMDVLVGLWDLLRHPFVLMLIGGFALKEYTDRRARYTHITDKKLEVISSVSPALNEVFSTLFACIRSPPANPGKTFERLDEALLGIFKKRFSIKTFSKVYFGNYLYSDRYDAICFALDDICTIVKGRATANDTIDDQELAERIKTEISSLQSEWPFDASNLPPARSYDLTGTQALLP